ncbi:MAG TPA: molybdate ABC transporter permease subunit [Candidatus Nanopelagicales bacterium]|nr:molybdate ABC transporter permease subunit [Candidatus Nanopelagicales bacterium]
MDIDALWLTLRLAALTTVILIIVAIPIAAWLAFHRRAYTPVLEAVVALPLVLPPTVLGYYLLVAMGSQSPLGQWWINTFGSTLAFSFNGLLVASIISSLPFAVHPLLTAFTSVPARLLQASTTLGAGWPRTIVKVALPLSRSGLATSAVLAFAHTLGEFGVVLMVGGNIPGQTRTLSIDVYDSVQAFDYSAAASTSAFLLVFSLLVLTITYTVNYRSGLPRHLSSRQLQPTSVMQ